MKFLKETLDVWSGKVDISRNKSVPPGELLWVFIWLLVFVYGVFLGKNIGLYLGITDRALFYILRYSFAMFITVMSVYPFWFIVIKERYKDSFNYDEDGNFQENDFQARYNEIIVKVGLLKDDIENEIQRQKSSNVTEIYDKMGDLYEATQKLNSGLLGKLID